MKLSSLKIIGVGGIETLTIPFDPSMNIICGPNGVGKTTILECVAHCFAAGQTAVLKRNVRSTEAMVTALVQSNGLIDAINFRFDAFEPNVHAHIEGRTHLSHYLLSLKSTRTFGYSVLNAVSRDPEKQMHNFFQEAKDGVNYHDLKNWFVNRYLYSAHQGALTHQQIANFELAKKCFSALDPQFSFARVNASTNEILVATPTGEIYYEYLSSGFKSCLSILFGIIKEVEFRFRSQPIRAEYFDGVVLIDELEMHLHPEWQYRISHVLTQIFPGAQFIVTTHSPHVIQSAEPNQIIALERKNERVVLRDLPNSDYGFKGWTIDEVLTDVMGMTDTRTKDFQILLERFTKAVDADDATTAGEAYHQLNASLHPLSHVRKLFRLQLAAIAGGTDDQA
jgi:predicted ATP-binding protein involved in virulence